MQTLVQMTLRSYTLCILFTTWLPMLISLLYAGFQCQNTCLRVVQFMTPTTLTKHDYLTVSILHVTDRDLTLIGNLFHSILHDRIRSAVHLAAGKTPKTAVPR